MNRRRLHPPPWRGALLALAALTAGAVLAGPVQAQSFYENNRSYYFGMGDLRAAGGMVDIPTGAMRLAVSLPTLPGHVTHPIAWFFNSQDASNGPLGTGTSLSVNYFFVDTGNGLDLIEPGHRRFRFTLQYEPRFGKYVYKDSRDPELLGAWFDPAGGYLTGWLTLKTNDRMYFTSGILTEIQDKHGVSVYLELESPSNRVVSLRTSQNYYPRVDFLYQTGTGRLLSISYKYASSTDPNNRSWSFAYDGNGRLSTMTAPGSRVTSFAWTTYTRADGQVLPLLSSITKPRGNTPLA